MKRHRIDSFQRKLKPLEYRGNNQLIKIDCTIHSESGSVTFIGEVQQLDIYVRDKDLEKVYAEVCRLLDEKTAIEWVPHLMVSVSSGVNPKFLKDADIGMHAQSFGIHLDIEVEHMEVGTKPAGEKVTRTGRHSISEGLPRVGRATRSYQIGGNTELDTLDALIVDTPENREALILLAAEFDRLYKRLDEMLDPKTIQRTLTAATARGLLAPAPASVTKRKKAKQ